MSLQIKIATHDCERGPIFCRASRFRCEIFEKRDQGRERVAQLVRKHCEEKFFGGHGGLGQSLLELELLFDLAALREVGKRQIEIFLIFLAVADDTLDADKGLLAGGVPE